MKKRGDTIWDLGQYLGQIETCIHAAIIAAYGLGLTIVIAAIVLLMVRRAA